MRLFQEEIFGPVVAVTTLPGLRRRHQDRQRHPLRPRRRCLEPQRQQGLPRRPRHPGRPRVGEQLPRLPGGGVRRLQVLGHRPREQQARRSTTTSRRRTSSSATARTRSASSIEPHDGRRRWPAAWSRPSRSRATSRRGWSSRPRRACCSRPGSATARSCSTSPADAATAARPCATPRGVRRPARPTSCSASSSSARVASAVLDVGRAVRVLAAHPPDGGRRRRAGERLLARGAGGRALPHPLAADGGVNLGIARPADPHHRAASPPAARKNSSPCGVATPTSLRGDELFRASDCKMFAVGASARWTLVHASRHPFGWSA